MSRQLRRFNYTNRVKIPASGVDLETKTRPDGPPYVVIQRIDLRDSGRHEPNDWDAAQVVLEARRLSTGSFQRSEIGTVASVKAATPPLAKVPLDEFADTEDITFRLKIVAADKRLLGDGDRLNANGDDLADRNPLIDVYLENLGEEVWRISWADEELGPRVLVNRTLPYARGLLTRDGLLKGIVVPQIVREILFRIIACELTEYVWAERWIEFAEKYEKSECPGPEDWTAIQDWLDLVVSKFATEHRLASKADKHLRASGEEM